MEVKIYLQMLYAYLQHNSNRNMKQLQQGGILSPIILIFIVLHCFRHVTSEEEENARYFIFYIKRECTHMHTISSNRLALSVTLKLAESM